MKKIIIAILVAMSFSSCLDKEVSAKARYEKALLMENGYRCKAEAVDEYKKIIEKYPDTTAGKEASERVSICKTRFFTIDDFASAIRLGYVGYVKRVSPDKYEEILEKEFGKRQEFIGLLSYQMAAKKDSDNVDVQNKRMKLYNQGMGPKQSDIIRATGGINSPLLEEIFNIDVCYENTEISDFFNEFRVVKGGKFHVIGKYNFDKECVEADAIDKMEGGEYEKKANTVTSF